MSTKRITLTPRLQAVANWVPNHSHFADIGTDHGYLPLFLLQEQRIATAIAADLNQGPLDAAKKTAQKYHLSLDLRLSNGLDKITPQEVDCVAIAGMGGLTIQHILESWKSPQLHWTGSFLLQPMSTQKELRFWLNQQGYTICQEQTICEGNSLYTIMKVKEEKETSYHPGELMVGRQQRQNPDPNRPQLFALHLKKLDTILKKLPQNQDTESRKKELLQQQEGILALREEWNLWYPQ